MGNRILITVFTMVMLRVLGFLVAGTAGSNDMRTELNHDVIIDEFEDRNLVFDNLRLKIQNTSDGFKQKVNDLKSKSITKALKAIGKQGQKYALKARNKLENLSNTKLQQKVKQTLEQGYTEIKSALNPFTTKFFKSINKMENGIGSLPSRSKRSVQGVIDVMKDVGKGIALTFLLLSCVITRDCGNLFSR